MSQKLLATSDETQALGWKIFMFPTLAGSDSPIRYNNTLEAQGLPQEVERRSDDQDGFFAEKLGSSPRTDA